MPKVNLEDIRLGTSKLSGATYIGIVYNGKTSWKLKRDITSDFNNAIIDRFAEVITTLSKVITSTITGKSYLVEVNELSPGVINTINGVIDKDL